MNKSFISAALIMSMTVLSSVPAYAGEGKRADKLPKHHKVERHNFNADGTRTTAKGEVNRHVEQKTHDDGFTRTITTTSADGKTGTRVINVVNDKEAGVHTRTVEGTTMDGKSYSGQSVTTKTDEGYVRQGSVTTPSGKTIEHSATAVIDKENHTLTKDSSITLPNGETKTRHMEKEFSGKSEATE